MQIIIKICLLSYCLLTVTVGYAVTPEPKVEIPPISAEAQATRDDIEKLLRGPDFNREITKKSWHFKNTEEIKEDEGIPEWLIHFIEFMEEYFSDDTDEDKSIWKNIGVLIAKVMEFILWVCVISILFFTLYYYRDYLKLITKELNSPKKTALRKPDVMFGLDIRQESLPVNVPEQVLSLWRDGLARDSLGLLYRATLSGLIHQYDFKFNDSATEKECADIVSHSGMKEIDHYLQALTKIWQMLAYGHRLPQESEVMALCKSWPEIFTREN